MIDEGLRGAWYSEVERRMWNDSRFRALSPIPPCGAGLWVYLLTTPELGSLPGLIVMGEAAMAEHLEWPIDGFRSAFAELTKAGMALADWKSRVVITPRVIGKRRPQSPNVITSWRPQWLQVPECNIKLSYYGLLKTAATGFGKPFEKAFGDAIQDPSMKASTIQEQEQQQEQEQEQEKKQTSAAADSLPFGPTTDQPSQPTLLPLDPPRDEPRELWERWLAGWRRRVRGTRPPVMTPERRRLAKARIGTFGVDDLLHAIDGMWASEWHVENGHTSFELAIRDAKHVDQFNQILQRTSNGQAMNGQARLNPRAAMIQRDHREEGEIPKWMPK